MKTKFKYFSLFIFLSILIICSGCSGSQSISDTFYSIQIDSSIVHGKIESPAKRVEPGGNVNITIIPNRGYELKSLLINESNVLSDVKDNKYTIKDIKNNIIIKATFDFQTYNLHYNLNGGKFSFDTVNTFTINDYLELAIPSKDNSIFLGWYDNSSFEGKKVTSVNEGTAEDKEFYAKWEDSVYKVSGILESLKYEYNNKKYALYDVANIKVIYKNTEDEEIYYSTTNQDGSYSLSIPNGKYEVNIDSKNFVSKAKTIEINEDGSLNGDTNIVLETPLVTSEIDVNGNVIKSGNENNIDYSNIMDGKFSITGADCDAYISGVTSKKFLFEANISSVSSYTSGSGEKYQVGLIFSAYGDKLKNRSAVFLDLTNSIGDFKGNLIRPWLLERWGNNAGYYSSDTLSDIKNEDGMKLSIIRNNEIVYIFINNTFVGIFEGVNDVEGALGFQTLSKTSATFSNYCYSLNEDLIDEMIKPYLVTFLPNGVFNDGMVLQRNKEINFFGTGIDDTEVTVTFAGITKKALVKDSKFLVKFDPLKENNVGQELVFSDGKLSYTYENVVVGEVWYGGGQSNMEATFASLNISRTDPLYMSYTNWNNIRVATQALASSNEEVSTCQRINWIQPNSYSDVYYQGVYSTVTALELSIRLGPSVPIGMINCSVGNTSITQWLPKEYTLNPIVPDAAHSVHYNAMAYPLKNFVFGGEIWYQGERDLADGEKYEELFGNYLDQTRTNFCNNEMPIFVVQLPVYRLNGYVDFRFKQWDLMSKYNGVYTICTIDLGNHENIHPVDKKPIGIRTADAISTYIFNMPGYNGLSPIGKEARILDDRIIISFENLYDNLVIKDSKQITNLQIGDINNNYYNVVGTLSYDSKYVIISNISNYINDITKVKYIRYVGDSTVTNPLVNLFSTNGLPVAPFKIEVINDTNSLYFVDVNSNYGGEIEVSNSLCEANEQVIISVKVNDGYELSSFAINGEEKELDLNGEYKLNISSNINIDIEFNYVGGSYTVTGSVLSDSIIINDSKLDLYDIDYSLVQLNFNNEINENSAIIDEDGSYEIDLEIGAYNVLLSYPNFVTKTNNITISDGEIKGETSYVIDCPMVSTSVDIDEYKLSGGNPSNVDLSRLEEHQITFGKNGDSDAYISGTKSNKIFYEVTIKNASSNGTGVSSRYQIGLIFNAYGPTKTRDAVLLDLTNSVGSYSKDLLRPWLSNGWKNDNGLVGDILDLEKCKTEEGIRITIIKDYSKAYIFLNDIFLTTITGISTEAGLIGFQNLSRTGGEFSNYKYSFNEELINNYIQKTI